MITYHLSFHKASSSYTGLSTFSSQTYELQDKEESVHVHTLCQDRTNMPGFFKGTVMAIRTDSQSLANDLLFPALMNGVIKTKNAATVGFVLLAAIWDLVTLPIRLLTLVPRLYHNARVLPKEHPLVPYLRAKGVEARELKGEVTLLAYEAVPVLGRNVRQGIRYGIQLATKEIPFYRASKEATFAM